METLNKIVITVTIIALMAAMRVGFSLTTDVDVTKLRPKRPLIDTRPSRPDARPNRETEDDVKFNIPADDRTDGDIPSIRWNDGSNFTDLDR